MGCQKTAGATRPHTGLVLLVRAALSPQAQRGQSLQDLHPGGLLIKLHDERQFCLGRRERPVEQLLELALVF